MAEEPPRGSYAIKYVFFFNLTCWGTFDDLSLRIPKSLSSAFSTDQCTQKLLQRIVSERSFTSCSEAQFKPRGCPSLI